MLRCCIGGNKEDAGAGNTEETPASKSLDGPSGDDKPSIEIEVVSLQDSTKWISEGRELNDEIPLENRPTDQLWHLQREDTLLFWSFYIKKEDKKLFVTYKKDSDEIRLEYDGPDVNRMFRVVVSQNGLIIGTKEEDRVLGKRNGLLSLYATGEGGEVVEWDFLFQHISATDHMKVEIRHGDWKWKSNDPAENETVVVERGQRVEQDWDWKKIFGQEKNFYCEIYVDQGSSTLYAAYGTDSTLGIALITDAEPAYRQFLITSIDKKEFLVYIRRKPDPHDYTTFDTEDSDERQIKFCDDERSAVEWKVITKQLYAGNMFFPPFHVSSSDQQQTKD